jgi:peptidoglycan/LPS O-acetylase OafA/YrhL
MKPIPVLNCLRGIAASLVCLFHHVYFTADYIQNESVRHFFWYGSLGVQVFFIISGIVIPLSMINGQYTHSQWGKFMARRLTRIEPPYLLSILVALICYYSLAPAVPIENIEPQPNIRDLLLHIGYMVPMVKDSNWLLIVYWTLAVEFQYYLLLSIIFPLALSGRSVNRCLFYAVFLAFPLVLNYKDTLFQHSPIFLLGIVYALQLSGIIKLKEYWVVSLLSIAVACFVLPLPNITAAVATILVVHHFPNFQNKALLFLGMVSYSLYLLHLSIGTAFVDYMALNFREDYHKPIVIISGYLVSVLAAYLFYRLIEMPSIRWSKLQSGKTPLIR